MSHTELFSGHARYYAAHRPTYPPVLVDYLAEVAPRQGLAWEAGCGSGQLTIPLASRFERVVATDASAEQIRHAAAHPNVEYRVVPAEASGLPDRVADLAVAAQAAHWFDLDGYYAEARRVLKTDGVIALVTYGRTTVDDAIDPIVEHFYSEVLGSYWAPEREHVDSGYRSLAFPFEEFACPGFEMTATWTMPMLTGYIDTWSAVRALEKSDGRERVAAFHRELAAAWQSGPEARLVRWPISLRVGRVAD